ncbi:MAG TPA: ABC transporter substrate-binding protein [Firmicutes bacterium]|nr:ABC transporter substrate-binding protein [Bacillota bacterium]
MKKRTSRILSLLLLCTMALGLLAGCSKSSGGSGSGSADKDTITVATMAETPSLGPYDHNATAGWLVNLLTYTSLLRLDDNLNPVPDLAESYEAVSDTCWEFKLRQDVKFHDGTQMTAADVKASLEYAKTFAEVSLFNDSIESVDVVDDYTVRINTKTPDASLLFNLTQHANAIVPKALIDSGNDFNTNPIGTGPYVWKEWKRGDQLEFEAFADYYLGEPAIKNVIWKIIPEGSSRTIALEAGEVDMVVDVESMDVDRIKENPDLATVEYTPTNVTWLMLNNEKPGLDNQNFRHAINSAIDKESVVTVALNNLGSVCETQVPNNLPGTSDANTDTYDLEKAKAYLEESGVDVSGMSFPIICSDDTKKRAGEVIQANLKEIGIEANIESMDLATYLSTVAEGNFVAAIGGYGMGDTISYLNGVYHSKSINGSNKSRLNNPEIDAMIDQASATIDQAQREALTEQICAKLNEICTQAPLYQPLTLRAFNADLQGVKVNPNGDCRVEDMSWK